MEKLLEQLLQDAQSNKEGLKFLKNAAVRCQSYELASKIRDIERKFFPVLPEEIRLKKLPELKKTHVVYLLDIDSDTGDVSQMLPIAYTEDEKYAKSIADHLKSVDGEDVRTYKYTQL